MKKRLRGVLLSIVVLSACPIGAWAQDLEHLGSARPIDLSGALSLRMNSYSTNRDDAVRDPFFWTITGSPTLSLYGVTLPFYFSFSQKQTDYRQPFNQFGLSPHYKWLRLHLGYRNISFSDFTLANHTFRGIGIEAEPSIFRFGFVYGRFLKAIDQPRDTLSGEIIVPTFARKGVAAKIGIGTQNNYVDLIFFKGKDDSTSVETGWTDAGIRPAENLVYGIKAKQAFLRIFVLDVDYGFSVYTSDITAEKVSTEAYKVPPFVSAFLTPRASTSFQMAGKASLAVRMKLLSLRLQYTRVEPDYQSMGSYFLNNDYENITIAPAWSMLKNRIRVSGSVGLQRNNLFQDKISITKRRINSVNVTVMPEPRLNITAFYTNYRINQERNVRLTLDTLRLEQFSDNLNVMAMLMRGTKQIRHNFSAGVNYQVLRDDNNLNENNNNTTSLNPSLGYRYQNTPNHFGANVNLTLNQFNTDVSETTRVGYTVGASKTLFDDGLRLNASTTYFTVKSDNVAQSNALSVNARVGYTIKEKHSLDLSASLVSRKLAQSEEPAMRDILANFGYTYNFGRK